MSPAKIFEFFSGYQKSAAMQAAVDVGLFTAIAAGHTTVPLIASACDASPKGVRVLCDYWTVHGMIHKVGDEYRLSPEAGMFLDRRSPAYLGDTLGFINGPFTDFFDHLTEAVRRGGCESRGSVESEFDGWVPFAERMGAMMFPAANAIAALLGPRSGRVLDVAAGHGLFGIVLAMSNPGLQVTALDWPKVLKVAERHAAKMGVADRFETLPGDVFTADLRGPYDTVLLTNLLHHFNPDECVALLKRLRGVLRPEGRLAILEFVPNSDRVSPPAPATFALVMLASTPSGDAYTFAELQTMLRSSGFAHNTLHHLEDSPEQVIISH